MPDGEITPSTLDSLGSAFQPLAHAVAARVLIDAVETSRRLTALGVPHALIGGLAVGLHGHPRATKDVDYLVGASAFERTEPLFVYREELRGLVQVGVVDLIPVPQDHPEIELDLRVPATGEIPVIGVETLVLLKLMANRPQDRADVAALLAAGLDVASTAEHLRQHGPDLVARFAELAIDRG